MPTNDTIPFFILEDEMRYTESTPEEYKEWLELMCKKSRNSYYKRRLIQVQNDKIQSKS